LTTLRKRPLLQPPRWCCVDCVIHHEPLFEDLKPSQLGVKTTNFTSTCYHLLPITLEMGFYQKWISKICFYWQHFWINSKRMRKKVCCDGAG